jgi:hypothetical protein
MSSISHEGAITMSTTLYEGTVTISRHIRGLLQCPVYQMRGLLQCPVHHMKRLFFLTVIFSPLWDQEFSRSYTRLMKFTFSHWVEASGGGLEVPEVLYSPVAKYFGTCSKIWIWILTVNKKLNCINSCQNEGLSPSGIALPFDGFGSISRQCLG